MENKIQKIPANKYTKFLKCRNSAISLMIIGGVLGILCFVLFYGIEIINPFYYEWLFAESDTAQSFFGWLFYRQTSGLRGLFGIDGLTYPYTLSMIFMDFENPLAIVLKPLINVFVDINVPFQICGIWGMLNYMLQGIAGALIMHKISNKSYIRISGILFIILSPFLMQRTFYHQTLASQYVILFAFSIWLYRKQLTNKKSIVLWTALLMYGTATHIYFAPIIGLIMFYSLLEEELEERTIKPFRTVIIAVISTLVMITIMGGFSSTVTDADEEWGESVFCEYSSNIDTLVNSEGHSFFLPALPEFSTEYEGFGYLGFGIILLVLFELFFLLIHLSSVLNFLKENLITLLCVLGLIITAFIIAIGPRVTLGEHILFFIPIPQRLHFIFRIFRSIGRFIWIVSYAIVIIAIFILDRLRNYHNKSFLKQFTGAIVVILVAIQLVDIIPYVNEKRKIINDENVYVQLINDSRWTTLSESHNVVFALDKSLTMNPDNRAFNMHMYAYRNKMKLSSSRIAHSGDFLANEAWNELQKVYEGNVKSEVLYWFKDNESMDKAKAYLHCEVIDGYCIGWVEE